LELDGEISNLYKTHHALQGVGHLDTQTDHVYKSTQYTIRHKKPKRTT